MKTKTLKQIGYHIEGVAKIHTWYNEHGYIDMKGFNIFQEEITEKDILPLLNDSGFGVQSIDGALCYIYDLYENNYKEYKTEMPIKLTDDDIDIMSRY